MVDGTDKPMAPRPWRPETDPIRLAVLGKTLEEMGESVSSIARCVIQGITRFHPETGKPNKRWLEEEIADVLAGYEIMIEEFTLDRDFIAVRKGVKMAHKRAWHERIRRGDSEDDGE